MGKSYLNVLNKNNFIKKPNSYNKKTSNKYIIIYLFFKTAASYLYSNTHFRKDTS